MLPFMKCPICRLVSDEVEIAVHLLQEHGWPYQKAMDWIRGIEEART
jgi:hypothetical protein